MQTLLIPIGEGRSKLCELVDKLDASTQVVFTCHGKPKAVLSAFKDGKAPWRLDKADDPARYGDLQSSVMEDWA